MLRFRAQCLITLEPSLRPAPARRREETRMHEIRFQDVADQAATGKIMIARSKTHDGRPVLVLRPRHENNTKDQDKNIQHFAYQMESVTRHAPHFKIVSYEACLPSSATAECERPALTQSAMLPLQRNSAVLWTIIAFIKTCARIPDVFLL